MGDTGPASPESLDGVATRRAATQPPRIIFIDLDGTLLTDNKLIPITTRGVLHEVVRRGTVEVAIASGRRLEGVLGYVEALGIDCHIVPFNGLMCITSAARGATELYNMALPSEAVNGAMRISSEGGHYALFYFRGERDPHVVSRPGLPERLNVFRFLTHVEPVVLDDMTLMPDAPCIKVHIVCATEEERDALTWEYTEKVGHLCTIVPTESRRDAVKGAGRSFEAQWFLEIMPLEANKGYALRTLCAHLDIDPNDAVAFGDGANDLDMLQAAGLAICPRNAVAAAAAEADIHSPLSNNENFMVDELFKLYDWLSAVDSADSDFALQSTPRTSTTCFGVDIGGTLCKVVVFEPAIKVETHAPKLARVLEHLYAHDKYGSTGLRSKELSLFSARHGGTFHFIHFLTTAMEGALSMIQKLGLVGSIDLVGATGGGAHKFEEVVKDSIGVSLLKADELECLVAGVNFLLAEVPDELFSFPNVGEGDRTAVTVRLDASDEGVFGPAEIFPYLLVNIGSGVSIMLVEDASTMRRVSGTALGGSTFLGLCMALTSATTFEEALSLALLGSDEGINLTVGDIYGGDYSSVGLPANVVASFFGKVPRMNSEDLAAMPEADIARALLLLITNNIGQIAYLNALRCDVQRIYFAGNFLRHNRVSMWALSIGLSNWSSLDGRTMEAIFFKHEGYFGAVGGLLQTFGIRDGAGENSGSRSVSPSDLADGEAGTSTAAS